MSIIWNSIGSALIVVKLTDYTTNTESDHTSKLQYTTAGFLKEQS